MLYVVACDAYAGCARSDTVDKGRGRERDSLCGQGAGDGLPPLEAPTSGDLAHRPKLGGRHQQYLQEGGYWAAVKCRMRCGCGSWQLPVCGAVSYEQRNKTTFNSKRTPPGGPQCTLSGPQQGKKEAFT